MAHEAGTPRWRQRLDEFDRTIDLFARTDAIRNDRPLTDAEQGGLVQFFELAVELGGKALALRLREEWYKPVDAAASGPSAAA